MQCYAQNIHNYLTVRFCFQLEFWTKLWKKTVEAEIMDDITGMDLKTISFIEISGSCWNYKIWASAGEKGREHNSGLKSPFPPKVSKHIRLFGGRRGSDLQGQGQQQACCLSHWWDVTAITQSFQPVRQAAWVWGEAHLLFWFQLPGRSEFPGALVMRQEATKNQQQKLKKKMQKRAIGLKRQHNKLVEGQHAGYICMFVSVPVQY